MDILQIQEESQSVPAGFKKEPMPIPVRASFVTRVWGALIDGFFALLFGVLCAGVAGYYSIDSFSTVVGWVGVDYQTAGKILATFFAVVSPFFGLVAGVFFGIFFNSLIETVTGATFGKIILGLRVMSVDGSPARSRLLWLRWAIKNSPSLCFVSVVFFPLSILTPLSGILSVVVFLGVFLALGKNRQTLHDSLSGTAVFFKR